MPQSFAEQLRSIPMSPNLGQSLERAHRFARDQSHRLVTLEHLLLALTEDAEAALILQSANVDLPRLGTDVSGYLGRLMEDMRAEPGTEPRPDPELLRVLQAAASAAQQSRRKQIDGAIVLAAIVGDGKSPAAGLLKSHGMTFEEAIRALQRANTKARLKPLAKAPTPAPPFEETIVSPHPAASTSTNLADPDPAEAEDAAEITSTVSQPLAAQSADEILAAARARIQKRSAAAARTEPAIAREPAASPPIAPAASAASVVDDAPVIEPVDPSQTKSLSAAIEAAMGSSSTARHAKSHLRPAPAPAEPEPPAAPSGGLSEAAKRARSPLPSLAEPPFQSAPPGVAALPFPARPLQPHEGPRRPPLPPRPIAYAQPQQSPSGRNARTPSVEQVDGWPAGRPPLANGSNAAAPGHAPAAPRAGPQGERGLMVEAVPRRMRVGVPSTAEVRIARQKVEGLLQALNGRDPGASSDGVLTRALSVRLRTAKATFWVDASTPETQWIENGAGRTEDDYLIWRWKARRRASGGGRPRPSGLVPLAGQPAVPPVRVRGQRHCYRWRGGVFLRANHQLARPTAFGRSDRRGFAGVARRRSAEAARADAADPREAAEDGPGKVVLRRQAARTERVVQLETARASARVWLLPIVHPKGQQAARVPPARAPAQMGFGMACGR